MPFPVIPGRGMVVLPVREPEQQPDLADTRLGHRRRGPGRDLFAPARIGVDSLSALERLALPQ